MSSKADNACKEKLVKLLGELATTEGFSLSNLEGVNFIRFNRPFPRMPVVYTPSIVIVGQGKKIGYLGNKAYVYDPLIT